MRTDLQMNMLLRNANPAQQTSKSINTFVVYYTYYTSSYFKTNIFEIR